MTIRERIEAAYRREATDRVPWTIYSGLLPRSATERKLRNMGLGLVVVSHVCTARRPNVRTRTEPARTPRGPGVRTIHTTPAGEVFETAVTEGGYGSAWKQDHLIKGVEDYAAVEAMVRDTVYEPTPDAYRSAVELLGDDGVVLIFAERSPLQKMWVELMGAERFGLDMLLEADRFWSLAELIAEKQREQFRHIADGPGQWVWFPENLTAPIVGLERFREHMLPWYNEQCDLLHAHGKRVVAHFDGVLAPLLADITKTDIDVIEAFTPAPDGDVTVAEARAAWPGKCLSLNFPSSVHLRRPEGVRAVAEEILAQAGDGTGLVVGVTENIPTANWQASLTALGETLQERGALPLR